MLFTLYDKLYYTMQITASCQTRLNFALLDSEQVFFIFCQSIFRSGKRAIQINSEKLIIIHSSPAGKSKVKHAGSL